MKYKHTNLIARNWDKLAQFYEDVFDCERVLPERHLSGQWLNEGTGVENAKLSGVHLRLPGYGDAGPTLEVFTYANNQSKPSASANREGFGHIAFEVVDVIQVMEKALKNGGSKVGEVTSKQVEGVGTLTFVYLTDPEGNIIEIQSWR
jgi:catechol 2,3-dioxygenase-like lactoylglutathione lyase family enzyme